MLGKRENMLKRKEKRREEKRREETVWARFYNSKVHESEQMVWK